MLFPSLKEGCKSHLDSTELTKTGGTASSLNLVSNILAINFQKIATPGEKLHTLFLAKNCSSLGIIQSITKTSVEARLAVAHRCVTLNKIRKGNHAQPFMFAKSPIVIYWNIIGQVTQGKNSWVCLVVLSPVVVSSAHSETHWGTPPALPVPSKYRARKFGSPATSHFTMGRWWRYVNKIKNVCFQRS